MELFVTKIDNEIERKIKKDPLREQVIWTKFANKLYPSINSTTREMKGFIIASLGLKILEDFKRKNIEITKKELQEIQVMYEMIIMYMLIEFIKESENKTIDISFLGKERGTSYYNETKHNPRINMRSSNDKEKRILVRQEQLGYIARYRSKLENTEKKEEILKIAFGDSLNEYIEFFKTILEKRNEGISYKDCFKNNKDKKIKLLKILQIEESKKDEYLKKIGIIDQDKEEKGRTYIYDTIRKNPGISAQNLICYYLDKKYVDEELKKILDEIKKVENFLVPLNNIFFEALDKQKLEVNKENIKKLKEAYNELKGNREIEDVIFERGKSIKYNNLKKALDEKESDKKIVKSIITDHQEIFENNKMEPWIKCDFNNQITISHKVKEKYDNFDWNNYYFIDVIEQIIRSMEPWEKQK